MQFRRLTFVLFHKLFDFLPPLFIRKQTFSPFYLCCAWQYSALSRWNSIDVGTGLSSTTAIHIWDWLKRVGRCENPNENFHTNCTVMLLSPSFCCFKWNTLAYWFSQFSYYLIFLSIFFTLMWNKQKDDKTSKKSTWYFLN